MKEILARYLWIILCLCLGCDIVDYDRAAAMRDDTLKEIINEGFCYIEGKHNLDIGLVRCSFWLSEDKTMMQLIDIVRNNGWWEVSQIKLKGRKYYGENWDFAFRRGDEMLLIRNGVTKVDILICYVSPANAVKPSDLWKIGGHTPKPC